MLNVLGDSIIIDYQPIEKTLCSNGYAYNYANYTIPDSLYTGSTRLEAEWLLRETGVNRFAWNVGIEVNSSISVSPLQELVTTASNDSIIRVLFPKGYKGEYSVEFKSPSLFPRKYIMVVRTHMDIGGIYNFYVNGQLLKSFGNDNKDYTFDYYDFLKFRGLMYSVTGSRYLPTGRFNSFDMYVDNLEDYGKATIKIEYKGPGFALGNGLVFDYIDFLPVD